MNKLLAISLVVIGICVYFGVFHTSADRSADFLFYPQASISDSVSLVAIDEKSLETYGSWPWREENIVALIRAVNLSSTKVIGYEYLPSKELGNVLTGSGKGVFPLEAGQSYINVERDGFVRVLPCFGSFALSVAQIADPTVKCKYDPERVNFRFDNKGFETVSAADVLQRKAKPSKGVVLIGVTAPNGGEQRQTPLDNNPLSGLVVQANLVDSILTGNQLTEMSKEVRVILTILVLLVYYLILRKIKYVLGLIETVVTLAGYLLLVIVLYHNNIWLDYFYLPLGVISIYITQLAYGFLIEQQAKNFIRKAFGKYVSNEVVEQLIKDKKYLRLGGERRMVTLLFSDVQSFTSLAETLSPEDTVTLLNSFLSLASDRVELAGGTLDKFIGDEIVAFWNAPILKRHHASLAASTALAIRNDMRAIADLSCGIGLNSGEAFVGNIGSPNRYDYTVVGDAVNITARLEELTRHYKVDIIVTKSFIDELAKAGDEDKYEFRHLDNVVLRGRKLTTEIYELVGERETKDNPARAV